jgi:hypothetical protein
LLHGSQSPGQQLGELSCKGGAEDEAQAYAGLGRCAMAGGRASDAMISLREARAIFQQIDASGSPNRSRDRSSTSRMTVQPKAYRKARKPGRAT